MGLTLGTSRSAGVPGAWTDGSAFDFLPSAAGEFQYDVT